MFEVICNAFSPWEIVIIMVLQGYKLQRLVFERCASAFYKFYANKITSCIAIHQRNQCHVAIDCDVNVRCLLGKQVRRERRESCRNKRVHNEGTMEHQHGDQPWKKICSSMAPTNYTRGRFPNLPFTCIVCLLNHRKTEQYSINQQYARNHTTFCSEGY